MICGNTLILGYFFMFRTYSLKTKEIMPVQLIRVLNIMQGSDVNHFTLWKAYSLTFPHSSCKSRSLLILKPAEGLERVKSVGNQMLDKVFEVSLLPHSCASPKGRSFVECTQRNDLRSGICWAKEHGMLGPFWGTQNQQALGDPHSLTHTTKNAQNQKAEYYDCSLCRSILNPYRVSKQAPFLHCRTNKAKKV